MKRTTSCRRNLRSPRAVMRYDGIFPWSLQRLSVLACTCSIGHTSRTASTSDIRLCGLKSSLLAYIIDSAFYLLCSFLMVPSFLSDRVSLPSLFLMAPVDRPRSFSTLPTILSLLTFRGMFPTLLSASIIGFASTTTLLLSNSHSLHQPDNEKDECDNNQDVD